MGFTPYKQQIVPPIPAKSDDMLVKGFMVLVKGKD
jgi:hypothetical protein